MSTCSLQFFGQSFTPMRWSPDSRLVQLYIQDDVNNQSKLHVLNPQLDIVYCWPEVAVAGSSLCHDDIMPAWTLAGATITAVCQRACSSDQCYVLDACWHQSQPDVSSSAEAALVRSLLAGVAFSPQEGIRELAFSPLGGLAAVIGPGPDDSSSDCPYKLYVLLPGCALESVTVDFFASSWEAAIVWSLAGDRLLIGCLQELLLVSTECDLILDMPGGACTPAFTPDGRYAAALGECRAGQKYRLDLQLFNARSGAIVFQHVWDGMYANGSSMEFNQAGDRLIVTDRHNAHAFDFGQGCKASNLSSRQVCEAIAGACSCTEDLIRGADDDDWFG